jgi:photosystem II stability/assembly factor-like uncharacterized protein
VKARIYTFLILIFLITQNLFSQSGWFWQNPLPQGNKINCAKYIGSNIIIAVTEGGTALKSENGGLNWVINRISDKSLVSLSFVNNNMGYISAYDGEIFKTTNKGDQWTEVLGSINNLGYWNSIHFIDENTGAGVGSNIYLTTNKGANWNIRVNTMLIVTRFILLIHSLVMHAV